jgi:hypothetical protein
MPNISKEKIEQAIYALEYGIRPQELDAITMLQGLLAQPEDAGSDWFYKLQFICRVLEGVSPDKTDMQTALGMAQSLKRDRWTAEKALQPITADMVTDEMVATYCHSGLTSMSHHQDMIAAAVNAWGAKKC